MELQISRHKISLSEKQVAYLEKKISAAVRSAGKAIGEQTRARVDIRLAPRQEEEKVAVEATLQLPEKVVVRAEEKALVFEAAVDLVEEKLRRQLERFKTRWQKRRRAGKWTPAAELPALEISPESEPQIVRRKRFSNTAPMHEEEAIEHLELTGHDFFLFNNLETDRWSVVYRRWDGNFGLIEGREEGEARES